MRTRRFGLVAIAMLAVFGGVVSAQSDKETVRSIAGDKWVITAEAGGVNYIEGGVMIQRAAGRSGRLLKGDNIAVGDRVSTASDGRAEILLNPGSYVRVAGDSEFEFKTTALEDLQIKLSKGSAIFEVFATNDFLVQVEAPKGTAKLVETGIYRVDVLADGTARLEVWKGKAEAGEATLKGGRVLTGLDAEATAVAKFDRDDKDEFELWSRTRAKELAKANSGLKDREMRNALMQSFNGGRWNTYDSFGLWVYSARAGRYCFLPFGYGWSSPYGYGFGADIWYYRLPRVIFYPPTTGGGGNGGGTVGGTRRPPARQPIERVPGRERTRPPFAEIQGKRSTGSRIEPDAGSGRRGGGGFTPGSGMGGSRSGSPDSRITPSGSPGPTRTIPPTSGIRGKGRID